MNKTPPCEQCAKTSARLRHAVSLLETVRKFLDADYNARGKHHTEEGGAISILEDIGTEVEMFLLGDAT